MDAAAAAGYLVVSFDRPGYGASTALDPAENTFGRHVRLLADAIAQAAARFPADGVFLAGHSIGGMIAMMIAAGDLDFRLTGLSDVRARFDLDRGGGAGGARILRADAGARADPGAAVAGRAPARARAPDHGAGPQRAGRVRRAVGELAGHRGAVRQAPDRRAEWFTLLVRRPGAGRGTIERAARARGVPLRVLDVPGRGPDRSGPALVLIRPDQYVAWTGDRAPDGLALIDRIRGSRVS
jgi:pimeloyl-ACP methyl ester carboxylesterase